MTTRVTMRFEFGDVVLVPFPFTNQDGGKRRPAVVINSVTYSTLRPDIIVLAISSRVALSPTQLDAVLGDWRGAGLIKPSMVKPVALTVERSVVLAKLGRLSPPDCQALRRAVAAIFGP